MTPELTGGKARYQGAAPSQAGSERRCVPTQLRILNLDVPLGQNVAVLADRPGQHRWKVRRHRTPEHPMAVTWGGETPWWGRWKVRPL